MRRRLSKCKYLFKRIVSWKLFILLVMLMISEANAQNKNTLSTKWGHPRMVFTTPFFRCGKSAISIGTFESKMFFGLQNKSDSMTDNKIVSIPVKGSQVYYYGAVNYTGSLDTLIKEISSDHKVGMAKKRQKINSKSFYWKRITHPYWYYGGHCLLLDVKKRKGEKWFIEMRVNYAGYKPNYPWRIRVAFPIDYYQDILNIAIKKSQK